MGKLENRHKIPVFDPAVVYLKIMYSFSSIKIFIIIYEISNIIYSENPE